MKEKNTKTRPIIILLLAIAAIGVIVLTVAGIYATRFIGQGLDSLMSQLPGVTFSEPLAESSQTSRKETNIFDQGLLITSVDPESPAAKAGIRRGTIILSINGQEVNHVDKLRELLTNSGAGSAVDLTILNGPKPDVVTVTLAAEPPYLGIRTENSGSRIEFGPAMEGFELPEGFEFYPKMMPNEEGDFNFQKPEFGILIVDVIAGSPAESAGLGSGDLIEAIDGNNVNSLESFIELIGNKSPGEKISLTISRDGLLEDVVVTLTTHPEDEARGFLGINPAPSMGGHGMLGRNNGSDQFGLPFRIPFDNDISLSGATIVSITPESPAASAGLEAGDVIEQADGQLIENVDNLIELIANKKPNEKITMSVKRGDETIQIEAKLGAHPEDENRAYLGVALGAFFNLKLEDLQEEGQILPEEFFYEMDPNFDFRDFFENPEDLSSLLPHLQEIIPDFREQEA